MNDELHAYYDVIGAVCDALLPEPESYTIVTTPVNEELTILTLRIDPTEVGKVIGKGGTIVKALITILGALDGKHKHNVHLKIPTKLVGIGDDSMIP